jgi:hypothetical protein
MVVELSASPKRAQLLMAALHKIPYNVAYQISRQEVAAAYYLLALIISSALTKRKYGILEGTSHV